MMSVCERERWKVCVSVCVRERESECERERESREKRIKEEKNLIKYIKGREREGG